MFWTVITTGPHQIHKGIWDIWYVGWQAAEPGMLQFYGRCLTQLIFKRILEQKEVFVLTRAPVLPPPPAAASWVPAWPSWPLTPETVLHTRSWDSARRWPAAVASRRLWPAAARCRPSETCTGGWGTCSVWRTTTTQGPATSCREQQQLMKTPSFLSFKLV